ncbi:MAG: DUF45 domain-containing protein [Candidatus Peregrinibacteria bacterium]|nr:DUF45 domain-containing protein [Candidatus Peregrinibacteria bacterium]
MRNADIPHRVERTRNKHSRAFLRENTIVIRLARNLSRTEEREHIENLLRRMMKHVLEERQKLCIDPFRHLLRGGQTQTITLASGRRYAFSLQPASRTDAVRTSTGFVVRVSPQVRRRALHRFLWNLLASAELARMSALVERTNRETLRVRIGRVKLRFASTQWGSCSPHGTIMLNSALLFVPPSILRYVIIHELAHRRWTDHSPAYWREVASALPQYVLTRKKLHNYRICTL